ncbi:HU family DNA-binding protein [Patescibacteria group bacterium]|nr:HU family DNA-binding protein [Patescibacteria group bacterium]
MNKADLAAALAEKTSITKADAERVIEAFVEIVTSTLKGGGEVTIAGFGTFLAKQRAGRMGVNPQKPTEKMQIPPVTVAKFKVGSNLKKALK